ncbi:phosphotransferase family protein [Nocardia sp. NPDC057668]|uniref:phosphotransferase family protein n=1 Tax=Nocardia sp. NPDC057668 TaxID=3346202 RepID=UPI00366EBBC5
MLNATLGLAGIARETIRTGLERTRGRGRLPRRAEELTTEWLRSALGQGADMIRGFRVLDADSGTAARVRIAVDGEAGTTARTLFVKLAPRDFSQHVLLNLFGLGVREVLAYRALGDRPPVRVPRCHFGGIDAAERGSVLILEDLSGAARFRTVRESLDETEAFAVVDALAGLHSTYWESARFGTDLAPLARRTTAEIRLGNLIRRAFLRDIKGHTADLIPAHIKKQCRMFYERDDEIDDFWAAQPHTLTHGDPHLGNLFFVGAEPGLLDWQIARAGAGIRDVAYFACASVEPELLRRIERELVGRYADGLAAGGVAVDPDRLWTGYRAATTELFLAAVCTAEAGDRMQPLAVSRVGVERAVAAVEAHDGFDLLSSLL